jgi:hypothetical protein
MELFIRIRKYENLHIVFWLVKDSCWMMEFRTLGAIMIIPTFLLAVYLVVKTIGHREVYINSAILCWITANSYWMIVEFFNDDQYKELSAIPFLIGFVFVALYYILPGKTTVEEPGSPGIPGGAHE